MRIAQISTGAGPVGPEAVGSVERLLWLLSRELTRRGHEVTTFGVKGSQVTGEFVQTLPGPSGAENSFDDWHTAEWVSVCEALKQSDRFDLVHSHTQLGSLALEGLANAPMVHTMYEMPEPDMARLWRLYPNARVIAASQKQYAAFPDLKPITVIPPGVDGEQFAYQSSPGDYVCFFGSFEPGNGAAEAIGVTGSAGMRLIMTGPSSPYLKERIQPLIDGKQVEYADLTEVGARARLLRNAKALICPAQTTEAFGLEMAEAMMCGTPVVALRVGVVPELVECGVSGFYTNDAIELPKALEEATKLDRAPIRQYAEEKFSVARMTRHHEHVYKAVCGVQAIA